MVFYLKVYTSIPELTTVQNFLQRCFKCKYISYQIDIYNVLEEVDCSLLKKISSMPSHPLYPTIPKTKEKSVCLLVPSSQLPRVNTQRFKNSFLMGYFSNIEQLFNVIWILSLGDGGWKFMKFTDMAHYCFITVAPNLLQHEHQTKESYNNEPQEAESHFNFRKLSVDEVFKMLKTIDA